MLLSILHTYATDMLLTFSAEMSRPSSACLWYMLLSCRAVEQLRVKNYANLQKIQ